MFPYVMIVIVAAVGIASAALLYWFNWKEKNKLIEELREAYNAAEVMQKSLNTLYDEHHTIKKEHAAIKEEFTALKGSAAQALVFLDEEKTASKEMVAVAANYEAKYLSLSKRFGEEVILNENLMKEVQHYKETAEKSLSQRKSSEVRTGKIVENMAPLMEDFPYAVDDVIFIGMPIDIIAFDDAGVHVVEVKTGGADLTAKQRQIRDHIKEGRVSFEVYRLRSETK